MYVFRVIIVVVLCCVVCLMIYSVVCVVLGQRRNPGMTGNEYKTNLQTVKCNCSSQKWRVNGSRKFKCALDIGRSQSYLEQDVHQGIGSTNLTN